MNKVGFTHTCDNHIHAMYAIKNCVVYCRKAEIEVLFDNKPSSSSEGDNLNSKAAAEAQVLVRAR